MTISIKRHGITLGPIFIRLSRRYLANWGFEALRVGGLRLWSRTSAGELMIASYHPRRSTCWHWSVSIVRRAPLWNRAWFNRAARRTGQWHDYYWLPFSRALLISHQDYHKKWGI